MHIPFATAKNTLPGLRQIFDTAPARPDALSFSEYAAMDDETREAFDEARLFWLTSGMRVNTFTQRQADSDLARIMRENRLAYSGRGGLILSGPPLHGKTEVALNLARRVEKRRANAVPEYRSLGEVPVVLVDAPSNGSGKALMSAICRFFHPDIPVPSGWATPRIFDAAIDQLRHARTQVLIIDEAHLLASRSSGDHGDPTDMIKEIQNQSPVTVVLVGVNLLDAAVFGTPRGRQVIDRCDRIELAAATASTANAGAEWKALVAAFDRALPLCDHVPGVLTANSTNLLQASEGCLGNLAKLVRRLVAAIVDESDRTDEHITPERLADALKQAAQSTGLDTPVPVHAIRKAIKEAS